ncbi:hypothetical protein A9Q84_14690 [Halobacteriovorax marinus]|uniref:Secreted protein n=1 Tax=Halobacteriovorax marinus TaxID=97084 RepID=A0A1Y5FBG8_9BACT|nr:hypothetical protein A9Q84_14690 [Halobacteriovorax marinus]
MTKILFSFLIFSISLTSSAYDYSQLKEMMFAKYENVERISGEKYVSLHNSQLSLVNNVYVGQHILSTTYGFTDDNSCKGFIEEENIVTNILDTKIEVYNRKLIVIGEGCRQQDNFEIKVIHVYDKEGFFLEQGVAEPGMGDFLGLYKAYKGDELFIIMDVLAMGGPENLVVVTNLNVLSIFTGKETLFPSSETDAAKFISVDVVKLDDVDVSLLDLGNLERVPVSR